MAIATSKSSKPSWIRCGEVLGADDVGAGLLGLARLVALGEHGDLDVLAEAVRERDRPAQLLVGVADVQPGAHVDLDGLVELRALELLDERDRLGGRVLALAVEALLGVEVCLAVLCQLLTHLHAHRARGAGDDLRRGVDVVGVQVLHLLLGDLAAAAPG